MITYPPSTGGGGEGEAGASAYEVAVANGFVGTEEEWLASLVGPEGPEGPASTVAGPAGPQGDQGYQGDPGPKGDAGDPGPAGADGVGVPAGGTAGQVLAKVDAADYNTEWADAAAGGASVPHMYVQVVSDETTLIATNQPVARRFFLNSARYSMNLDLTDFRRVRLNVYKDAVAAAAAAKMRVMYKAGAWSSAIANWSDIGVAEVVVATNVTNQPLTSGWVDLAVGAMADVWVAVAEEGGDGVLDPAFGTVALEFN